MIGRTLEHHCNQAYEDGVIADFDVTREMLKYFIRRAIRRAVMLHPRVVISVPSGVTR